jgi:cytochrome c-type biogenesis protein
MEFEANISLPVAFLAGLLSFLSPCVLPLIPVYLGYLTGVAVSGQEATPRLMVLAHALMFILGFTFVFVALGATAGLVFGSFRSADVTDTLIKIGGALLIILGLHMSGLLKWLVTKLDEASALRQAIARLDRKLDELLLPERRMQAGQGQAPGFLRSGVIGMAFAAGWTPCIGPLLGLILTLGLNVAAQTDPGAAVLRVAALLLAYSLGLAVPFFVTALALSGGTTFLRRLNRHAHAIEAVSALFLIGIGALLLTGSLSSLNQYFSEPPAWLYTIESSLISN